MLIAILCTHSGDKVGLRLTRQNQFATLQEYFYEMQHWRQTINSTRSRRWRRIPYYAYTPAILRVYHFIFSLCFADTKTVKTLSGLHGPGGALAHLAIVCNSDP